MVSHTDSRTHCVVNNPLPIIIIFILKRGMYLFRYVIVYTQCEN